MLMLMLMVMVVVVVVDDHDSITSITLMMSLPPTSNWVKSGQGVG